MLHKRFAFTFRGVLSPGLQEILESSIIESCLDPDGISYCFLGVNKPIRLSMFLSSIDMWNKGHEDAQMHIIGKVDVFSKFCRASDSPILKRIRVERFKAHSGNQSTYCYWVVGDKANAVGGTKGVKSEDTECMDKADDKGNAEGMAEGNAEGMAEGMAKGMAEGMAKLAAEALAKHAEALASHARMFHIQSRIVAAGGSIDAARDALLAAQEHIRNAEAQALRTLEQQR